MRLLVTHFAYSDWLFGYKLAFDELRAEFEGVMDEIEKEEKEQLGNNLDGTKRDLQVIRSMLKGIEYKENKFMTKIYDKNDMLFEKLESDSVGFGELKLEVKYLSLYLCDENLQKLREIALANGLCNNSKDKQKVKELCVRRRRLKIRVLGMPQSSYPFAITTDWSEVGGSMAENPDECQIGSIVRLDLKHKLRGGSMEPIIANIAYAKDELNEEGELKQIFTDGFTNIPHLDTLKNTTWLPLGMEEESIRELKTITNVSFYIKAGNRYAFHPDFENEIPIFDVEKIDKMMSDRDGELCSCTIDIRRDRMRGSLRYYVTEIDTQR
jgi:hypothetical protein